MKGIAKVVQDLWDGDVTVEQFTEGLSDQELNQIERVLDDNPELFKNGVPFPDDSIEYKTLLEKDEGAILLQRTIDKFE